MELAALPGHTDKHRFAGRFKTRVVMAGNALYSTQTTLDQASKKAAQCTAASLRAVGVVLALVGALAGRRLQVLGALYARCFVDQNAQGFTRKVQPLANKHA